MMTRASLIERTRAGERFKYVYFWGHKRPHQGEIGAFCLSNWFHSPFEVEGSRYPTAEHFMMAEKARLFSDQESLRKILDHAEPGAAKRFGRGVRGFVQETWDTRREEIVFRGAEAKFRAHPECQEFLLATGARVLVEAAPNDPVWGIGLEQSDPKSQNPKTWKGLNLLGFTLMAVREKIRSEL